MTIRPTRARVGVLLVAAAILLIPPASVAAHAELLKRAPGNHSTVAGTPAEISATFSEPLEADGSTFSIRNAAGERLAAGRLDAEDPSRLIIDPAPELAPGTYEVRWQASSSDGHLERGTWSFTVVAAATPAPTPTPAPTVGASASPSGAPSATASASLTPLPSPSTPPTDPTAAGGSDVILPIVIVLALVALGAGFLLSRRRPA